MRRYKLESLLAAVSIALIVAGLLVVFVRQYREQAEPSLRQSMSGVLQITNPNLTSLRHVETRDPFSWKWRIDVPPGTRLETGIEIDGKYHSSGPPIGGGYKSLPRGAEAAILTVSISPPIDGLTTVTVKLGEQTLATSTTNLTRDDWLPLSNNRDVAGVSNTVRLRYGEPIRLVRRRQLGTSGDDWHPLGGRPVGLVVWIIPRKAPPQEL